MGKFITNLLVELQSRLQQEIEMADVKKDNPYFNEIRRLQRSLGDITYPTSDPLMHLSQIKTCLVTWLKESKDTCRYFSIKEVNCQYRFFNPDTNNNKGAELMEYMEMILNKYFDALLEGADSTLDQMSATARIEVFYKGA